MKEGFDSVDRQLIALLRDDSRLPTAVLAKKLGVSRGTVQNRITRLFKSGVLLSFTVRMASEAPGQGVRAMTSIEVHGNATDDVVAALKQLPEVLRVHSTNGRWDLVAELCTDDLVTFDRVLRDLRDIRGVANSETNLLLASYK
jgi:DNA-binding Lrp family transcriptional regulator